MLPLYEKEVYADLKEKDLNAALFDEVERVLSLSANIKL